MTRPHLTPDALDTTGCAHDWWPLGPSYTVRRPRGHVGVLWSCRWCRSLAGTDVAMRSEVTAARWGAK